MNIKLINRKIQVLFLEPPKENEGIYGTASFDNLNIKVNKTLCFQQQQITLSHELIHHMSNGNTQIKLLTEKQTEALAIEFLYFIRHNPKIIEYLKRKK